MAPRYRRVAVTGLGAVSALGRDVPSLWRALIAGECGIRPIANIATDRLTARTAAEVRGFDPAVHFDGGRLQMLDRTSQFALVAAREAMMQAAPFGVPALGVDPGKAGAVFGAGLGLDTIDSSYQTLYGEGSNRLHPFTVPRVMPNAPASHISIEYGLRGPSFATASACASSTHAVGLAFHMIRSGLLDFAVTGGSDASLTVGHVRAWDALRVLSPDTCRPFSKDRTGLVLGEGAAVLVLEEWEHACARGATIHAEIAGFGMSADAGDITSPNEAGAAQAIAAALADGGLNVADVHYVNAHGTGTRLNDRTETAALKRVFGDSAKQLAASSIKSMLGHCLNAAGALEAAATVLALRDGIAPPTIGYRELDPECDLDYVPNAARRMSTDAALSNSFAFGGFNAVLAFRK
ncbi:MAG TPA: beta-ketoacyl-[acyl-carrier-protein] synthase family protein, partial [Burkholderiaceae bacterium]|nr:beta-ketoacyl-[acyl-carrier-protein] synthase family protein [Burkholderiaceae bacterium]